MTGWLGRIVALALLLGLAACGPSKFKTYSGPPVTQIVVNKGARQMLLLNGNTLLKAYRIGLGNEPIGHKQFEGDGKTPEGLYYIDRRNPDSRYHLSIGISYPNPQDAALAAALGQSAGSDIFIHGQGPEGRALSQSRRDWTVGCIAVTDAEVEDIYAMVRDGTPILITP
ncbi:L,D-transpeptidase family protein [Paracoccus methylovorus]|uniref:L,D-transpeptidase family protein n=1 Tax=Paracoccus methylovorus TaxID=2812658 RepID=A0ABX7JKY7_9RHOB|nr:MULTISPECIES: L,D-transpeptidase family protein [Paracoccus]QRZ14038.1 L,D-transpeptidase family protein [Paracoccus methylovorus]